jgi:hypothetical protein
MKKLKGLWFLVVAFVLLVPHIILLAYLDAMWASRPFPTVLWDSLYAICYAAFSPHTPLKYRVLPLAGFVLLGIGLYRLVYSLWVRRVR